MTENQPIHRCEHCLEVFDKTEPPVLAFEGRCYRLDRIGEITGADLSDPETRLNLAVALRVQGLLDL